MGEVVLGQASLGGGSSISVKAQLKNNLWMTWTSIALRSEAAAWQARRDGLASETPSDYLMREHEPSLVGVAAASHALDGLYGDLRDTIAVPRNVRDAWEKNKTARHARILETLRLGFKVGKKQVKWATEFEWLFKARDSALHHLPEFAAGDPHPLIPGSVASSEVANYRAEACTRAVDILVDVLMECSSNPKPTTQAWVDSAHVAERLEARSDFRQAE